MSTAEAMRAAKVLDVRGAKCPMPIVKAKEAVSTMAAGEVLRVEATDPGSVLDFQGWVKTNRSIALLKQETIDEGGKRVFVHYLEKKS